MNNILYLIFIFGRTQGSAPTCILFIFNYIYFINSRIVSYKYGLNSSIGNGSLYNIELKHAELVSSIIINKVTSGFFNFKLFSFTPFKNKLYKPSCSSSFLSYNLFIVLLYTPHDKFLEINFNNNEKYMNFLNMLQNRSELKFDVSLNEEDKILTLSTCYKENDRVVLHAKLIKMEVRNGNN